MNYASIRTCDIANGEGVRVSLFVSGCTHHCKGCFNEEAQSFDYGEPFTREVEDQLLAALEPDYIAGLTLLGGEPMEPANQRALLPFLKRFRERFGDTKTLWVYTGCVLLGLGLGRGLGLGLGLGRGLGLGLGLGRGLGLGLGLGRENSLQPDRFNCEVTAEMLSMIDVLVDGPFVESLKDISLQFRGSSNQRILKLR